MVDALLFHHMIDSAINLKYGTDPPWDHIYILLAVKFNTLSKYLYEIMRIITIWPRKLHARAPIFFDLISYGKH
jgi:hypothetical protein